MSDLCGIILRDQYFLRKLVGRGGMADIYLAWDQVRSTQMAIKVLRKTSKKRSDILQMFTQESELLEKLQHPDIVRFYEFAQEQDVIFIVMEWVEGANLQDVIKKRESPFCLEEVSTILQPVYSALNYAHSQGIFHCDIKPANILMPETGKAKLTDFGISRLVSEKGIGGTPLYAAPEQFANKSVDARTDIYSLGVTMYEMLSGGLLPFRGDSPNSKGNTPRERIGWEHLNLPLPHLSEYNRDIPPAVVAIIEKALNKNPNKRFASTMELGDAFEQARLALPIKEKQRDGEQTIIFDNITHKPPKEIPKVGSLPPQQKTHSATTPPADYCSPQVKWSTMKPIGMHLAGLAGDMAGQFLPITPPTITIGRQSGNQIRLSEPSVSRKHATILRTRRGVYVRDEGSTLGTFVNRQRIAGPLRLKNGDVIQIGYYQVFEFHER